MGVKSMNKFKYSNESTDEHTFISQKPKSTWSDFLFLRLLMIGISIKYLFGTEKVYFLNFIFIITICSFLLFCFDYMKFCDFSLKKIIDIYSLNCYFNNIEVGSSDVDSFPKKITYFNKSDLEESPKEDFKEDYNESESQKNSYKKYLDKGLVNGYEYQKLNIFVVQIFIVRFVRNFLISNVFLKSLVVSLGIFISRKFESEGGFPAGVLFALGLKEFKYKEILIYLGIFIFIFVNIFPMLFGKYVFYTFKELKFINSVWLNDLSVFFLTVYSVLHMIKNLIF